MKNKTCRAIYVLFFGLVTLNVSGQGVPAVARPDASVNDLSIQGRVYLPNGQPLGRSVRVELRGPRATTQTIDTDNNGSFSFRSVTPGEYTVYVDAGEEFEPANESIMADSFLQKAIARTRGRSDQISIYLKPRRSTIVPASTTDAKLAEVPRKAVDHYESGTNLFAAGKFDEAVLEFRKAIEVFPNFYQAYIELGKTYLKLANFDDAITALQAALKLEPNNFAARLHLGMAYLNQKKFPLAEEQLTAAAKIDTYAVTPQYYLGVIKYELNDIDGALAAFEKANELNGSRPHPMLHKYLAGVYLKKNDNARAAAELEIYLAQSPDAKDSEQIRKTIEQLKKPK